MWLLEFVKHRSFLILLGFLMVGLGVGWVGSWVFVPQWETRIVFKIAKVGIPGSKAEATAIEPAQAIVERLKFRTFQDRVLLAAGVPVDSTEGKLFHDTLKSRSLSDPGLVEVRLRAFSPDKAKSLGENTVAKLVDLHKQSWLDATDKIKVLRDEAQSQLGLETADRNKLYQQLRDTSRCSTIQESTQCIVLSSLLEKMDEHIQDLKVTASQYNDALSPIRSYPSSSLDDEVTVSLEPVTASPTMILGGGAVLGLAFGIFWTILKPLDKAQPVTQSHPNFRSQSTIRTVITNPREPLEERAKAVH